MDHAHHAPSHRAGSVSSGSDPLHPVTQEWERTYAMWTHLLLLAGHFIPLAPTLILWLVKRDQSPYVDDHGKEAVNFQISLLIYFFVSGILVFAAVGIVLIPMVYVLAIVGMIMAAMAASKGKYYRYPACIRFLK